MNDGGAAPKPRKPRRRRLSRRRFRRRVAWCVLLLALVLIGTRPALHSLSRLTRHHSHITMRWDVVRISGDRRAIVIRVDECGVDYAGADVVRVGANVRLTVSTRPDGDSDGALTCGRFDEMPTHVVHLGFALPSSGHVLASGCPRDECDDDTT